MARIKAAPVIFEKSLSHGGAHFFHPFFLRKKKG
jgi:hypothetical protein